jgi:hypothetical protein
MTGFDSKRQMAKAKLDDDDDTQVYADTLLIVYQRGFADGKAAANAMHDLARLGQEIEQEPLATLFGTLPVFDTPPAAQRIWVGLTPEEVLDLFDINNVYGSKWIEFARTVEAKLKEKNGY